MHGVAKKMKTNKQQQNAVLNNLIVKSLIKFLDIICIYLYIYNDTTASH